MSDKSLSKKLPLLGGLLAAQAVIVGLLYWQGSSQETVKIEPLLAFEAGEIDRIEMLSQDKSLNLRKEDGRWVLLEGLPADEAKLTEMLDDISELRGSWPVTTTVGAHERFKVGDDNFQHRVNLYTRDQETASLILGTAPGFRQVHVRRPGESDVYNVDLSAFVVEPDAYRWLDTALLQPEGEIESLAFGDFVIRKENDKWSVPNSLTSKSQGELAQVESEAAGTDVTPEDSPAAGDIPATGADEAATGNSNSDEKPPVFDAEGFAKALAEIRVLGLADKQAELDVPDAKADTDDEAKQLVRFKVSVSSSDGDYIYELLSRDNNYYIRRGDFDATFRVSKTLYDRFDALRQLAIQANS